MDRCTAFECCGCGERVTAPDAHDCGEQAAGFTLVHDAERLRERFQPGDNTSSQWRYEPFLPVSDEPVSLGEGDTALVDAPTLGADIGVTLSLKLEGNNPTGSTKDRGSSVLVTRARQIDAAGVACASTGNAAASLAAYAARSSLACRLFVPERVPAGKAVQPRVYGADVRTVAGSYADAYQQCRRTTDAGAWVDRSSGASPYTAAGARTLGYELAEQTDSVPDWIVVPMGNGGTIAGVWEGFQTFADLGFVDRTPRMLGVQAAATAPIHDEAEAGDRGGETTCADSIDVGTPHREEAARRALSESGGTSVAVEDDAIRTATTRLGQTEGVFVEPACAAGLAGLETALADGTVAHGDTVVAVMTGNGLKDTATARRAVEDETVTR